MYLKINSQFHKARKKSRIYIQFFLPIHINDLYLTNMFNVETRITDFMVQRVVNGALF